LRNLNAAIAIWIKNW